MKTSFVPRPASVLILRSRLVSRDIASCCSLLHPPLTIASLWTLWSFHPSSVKSLKLSCLCVHSSLVRVLLPCSQQRSHQVVMIAISAINSTQNPYQLYIEKVLLEELDFPLSDLPWLSADKLLPWCSKEQSIATTSCPTSHHHTSISTGNSHSPLEWKHKVSFFLSSIVLSCISALKTSKTWLKSSRTQQTLPTAIAAIFVLGPNSYSECKEVRDLGTSYEITLPSLHLSRLGISRQLHD